MQLSSNSIARELGTAVAVLAMYLLLLLAPWHQAAALQHELADLGYASATTLDLCGGASADEESGATGFKCPVAGIGKFEFAGIEPSVIDLGPPAIAGDVTYAFAPVAAPLTLVYDARQPRAPPPIA